MQPRKLEAAKKKISGFVLRTRLFEPLGMKDTFKDTFYVPQEKLLRLALVHNDAQGGGLVVDENRPDPKVVPLGPSGGGAACSRRRWTTRASPR